MDLLFQQRGPAYQIANQLVVLHALHGSYDHISLRLLRLAEYTTLIGDILRLSGLDVSSTQIPCYSDYLAMQRSIEVMVTPMIEAIHSMCEVRGYLLSTDIMSRVTLESSYTKHLIEAVGFLIHVDVKGVSNDGSTVRSKVGNSSGGSSGFEQQIDSGHVLNKS